MARFNPEFQAQSPGNYIQYAQGLPPRRSIASLFQGAGDTFSAYLNDRATTDQLNMSRDAVSGVDQIAKDSLGGAPVDPSLFDPTTLPPAGESRDHQDITIPPPLQQALDQKNRLQTAFDQGKLSDISFTTKTNELAQRMKAKYPQWADKVDAMVSSAVYSNTTNDVRRSLLQMFTTSASNISAEEKRKKSLLDSTSAYLTDRNALAIYKQVSGQDFNMDNFDENSWLIATGSVKKQALDRANEKAQLDLEAVQGKSVAKKAKTLALQHARDAAESLIRVSLVSKDPQETALGYSKLEHLIKTGLADGQIDQKEMADINQLMPQLRVQMNNAADALSAQYSQYITNAADLKQIRDEFMRPLTIMQDALTNKNFGVLGAVARENEVLTKNNSNKILRYEGNLFAAKQAASAIWGEGTVNRVLAEGLNGGKFLDPTDQAIYNKISLMLMYGTPLDDIMQLSPDGTDLGSNPGKVTNTALEDYFKLASGPSADPVKVAPTMKKIFEDPAKVYKYASGNPEQAFNTFTSIYDKFKNTELGPQIYKWTRKSAEYVLQPLMQDINDSRVNTDNINIHWDEKAKRFALSPFQAGMPTPINPLGVATDGYFYYEAQKSVALMNRYLDKLEPMAKANGDSLDNALTSILVDPDFKEKAKQGGLLTRMGRSFFEYLKSVSQPDAKGKDFTKPPPLPEPPPQPKGFQEDQSSLNNPSVKLLTQFEGFIAKAKYDVNAFRAGYGSDTITRADGTVERVRRGTVVTKEDAMRDLARRIPEFQATVIEDIGQNKWDSLSDVQQAALTSLTYNYGELPSSVVRALKNGDSSRVAEAIAALQTHNKGINKKRRLQEAQLFASTQ